MDNQQWLNRIVGEGAEAPDQLLANPYNARIHPQFQQDALAGVLDSVGWVDRVIVNRLTGHIVDGHLRVMLAMKRDEALVPVQYVELTEDEEKLVLATFDPITALAVYDRDVLDTLLRDVNSDSTAIQEMLANLAADVNLYTPTTESITADQQQARPSLSDRFVVPPFSVLDARQGYWQERKRQWLALGIQSELGRGENLGDISATMAGITDEDERAACSKQRRELPARIRGKLPADSGGQPLPLDRMANGRSPARKFGQDLMRGEHVVGDKPETASLKGGLTFGTSIHPYDATGQKRNSRYEADQRSNITGAPALPIGATQTGTANMSSGTSIFDPVLCELAYRWFTPPDGAILDPFAGGSVRGIVAALLGRSYTGVDLRPEQVSANEAQAGEILASAEPMGDTVQVKISAKSARQLFNGCDPDYIRDVCHAHCCESSTSDTGTMITIHPSEISTIEARGGMVRAGLLQPRPGERKCPFKTTDDLCGLHFTPDKPFGCIASPFTLNANNTLIIRNRYRLLKCYNDGRKLPAYVAFRASLNLIFGEDEAQRICDHLDNGGGDMLATVSRGNYQMLKDNDAIKHGDYVDRSMPRWIVGDSRNLSELTDDEYDFVFSCPPYFDLEIYSDDAQDLSNAGDYTAFLADYRAIIAQCAERLANNRFACFVVGDIRDKAGMYRNFVSDTISAWQDAGLKLYNEAILVTAVGSLPIRVGKQFESGRKLGKTHQNVLVFIKGDPRKAVEACGAVEVVMPDELEPERV